MTVFALWEVCLCFRVYDDFNRLLFLQAHRESSGLTNELPEESDQFRFLRATCLVNLKGSVGLILTKASVMRISTPIQKVVLVFYSITVFHSFETPYSTFRSFPCSLSSMFCLSGTCWVFTLVFYRLLYSS